MIDHILPVLSHIWSTLILLARLPIKLTFFFGAFGMTEEFWPSTHSPMLLLSVILHQADRLSGQNDQYYPILVRLLIVVTFDKICLTDWILIFVLATLWHYTARPEPGNVAAWRMIRKRQKAMVIRVITVMRNFYTIQASGECSATKQKTDKSDEDELSIETLGLSDDLQDENNGQHLLWIDMDNAPAFDDETEDPCLVPSPRSPFFMAEGIVKALRTESVDDTINY